MTTIKEHYAGEHRKHTLLPPEESSARLVVEKLIRISLDPQLLWPDSSDLLNSATLGNPGAQGKLSMGLITPIYSRNEACPLQQCSTSENCNGNNGHRHCENSKIEIICANVSCRKNMYQHPTQQIRNRQPTAKHHWEKYFASFPFVSFCFLQLCSKISTSTFTNNNPLSTHPN